MTRMVISRAFANILTDDVDAVHADALRRGLTIVAPPRGLFYGQRQFLLPDTNGALIDISTLTEPSDELPASPRPRRRHHARAALKSPSR